MTSKKAYYEFIEIDRKEDSKTYNVIIKIPMIYGWINNPKLIIKQGNEHIYYDLSHLKNDEEYAYFSTNLNLKTYALYKYLFSFNIGNNIYYVDKNGTIKQEYISLADMGKLSINYASPKWSKGAIMYHIIIDRYRRGSKSQLKPMPNRNIHENWSEEVQLGPDNSGRWCNDFYGGDLLGIIEQLDYLLSLGVNIIYLSPIFESQSYHRYDGGDFEKVDPYIGLNEDLELLCYEAHKRGMKVIIDVAFNHTGDDSKYFNLYDTYDTIGASKGYSSPYLPFYHYYEEDGKLKFYHWFGNTNMIKCNADGDAWSNYITGVGGIIDKWFERGIDGLRLDVPDEYSDEFTFKIHEAVVRNKPDGFILGEVWENPMCNNRNYLASGRGMHSVMNYNFMNPYIKYFRDGNYQELINKINEINSTYPDDAIFSGMNFTSTHDICRGINLFAKDIFEGRYAWDIKDNRNPNWQYYKLQDESYIEARNKYMAYVFTLGLLPGIFSIYYGDEIGMQGVGDLLNRRPFTWDNIDYEILNLFKYIGRIRGKEQFLQGAKLEIQDINEQYFSFERISDKNRAFIAINRTNNPVNVPIPSSYETSEPVYTLKRAKKDLIMPYGGIVLKK